MEPLNLLWLCRKQDRKCYRNAEPMAVEQHSVFCSILTPKRRQERTGHDFTVCDLSSEQAMAASSQFRLNELIW